MNAAATGVVFLVDLGRQRFAVKSVSKRLLTHCGNFAEAYAMDLLRPNVADTMSVL